MPYQINCPYCSATLSISDSETREEIGLRCNQCNQPLRVKIPREDSGSSTTSSGSSQPQPPEQPKPESSESGMARPVMGQPHSPGRGASQAPGTSTYVKPPQSSQPPSSPSQSSPQQATPPQPSPPQSAPPQPSPQSGPNQTRQSSVTGTVRSPAALGNTPPTRSTQKPETANPQPPLGVQQPTASHPGSPKGVQGAPVGQPIQQTRTPPLDQAPIVGTLVDAADGRIDGEPRESGVFAILEPLLKTKHPTDVSLVTTAILGAIATLLVYWGILIPMQGTAWGRLFFIGGWITYGIMFLTFWSIAILILKLVKLKAQRRSLSFDLLPAGRTTEIDRQRASELRTHVRSLPIDSRRNFLARRVLLALGHFEARGDVQEVGMAVQSQSDIDGGRVESSYTMLHVFIWTVPILGFIGTVLGIGQAVDGFSDSLQSADELDAIKASLTSVTAGLATAFNTTLIALVMSIVIMFPANSLQKSEEDLLTSIDQYCNDHLIPRLKEDVSNENRKHASSTESAELAQQMMAMLVQASQGNSSLGKSEEDNGLLNASEGRDLDPASALTAENVLAMMAELNEKIRGRQSEDKSSKSGTS